MRPGQRIDCQLWTHEVTGGPDESSFQEVVAPEGPVGWVEGRHGTWRWRQ